MQTLAEKYPEAVKRMRENGFKSLANMCGRFYRNAELARALGMDAAGTGVGKWMNGDNLPTWPRELAAKEWLKAQKAEEQAAADIYDVWKDAPPAKTEPPPTMPAPTDTILMVVAPACKAEKVQRVLSLIGCEVVEV